MTKKLLVTLFILTVVMIPSSFVRADVIDNSVQGGNLYQCHLYYDHGQLYADRDFKIKYDIIPDQFIPEVLKTATPYWGRVISVKNKVEAVFRFDPRGGKPAFTVGKISVKAPYFADASKINFYDNNNKLLLTLDVSGSSFCNDDGTCNSDVGENYQNCPNDCKPTPTPSASQLPVAGGGLPLAIILGIVGIVVVIVILAVWFIIKKKRKGAESAEIPPSIPPTTQ